MEINEGLQVGSNKLIQEKDNSKDYNRHGPQREEGEVYSIPSLPAFRQPVDEDSYGKKDKDKSVFIKYFRDNAFSPLAPNSGDHTFGSIPGSSVCFSRVKVGTGTEKESCKSDEDKSEHNRPSPVDPLEWVGGKNPGIDIVNKSSKEYNSHPNRANDESRIREKIFKSDKGSKAQEGNDSSAKFFKVAP